jgi:DNA primase
VIITEGPFDALSFLTAGYNACAIFGVSGFNVDWVQSNEITFAFDSDAAGESWVFLAEQLKKRGMRIFFLAKAAYEGHKDINELWMHKRRINMMVHEWEPPIKVLPQGIT